jgi:hypothetical protein
VLKSTENGSKCNRIQPRCDEQTSCSYRGSRNIQGNLSFNVPFEIILFKIHDVLGTEEQDVADLPGNLKALLLLLPKDDFYKEALAEKGSDSEARMSIAVSCVTLYHRHRVLLLSSKQEKICAAQSASSMLLSMGL